MSQLTQSRIQILPGLLQLTPDGQRYLERNYRWENGTPIGYWEEERLGYDELGNSEVEYVAHLDSGIQVIFYPNGEFSYEYDPYERERDAGLTFNSLASNYGSQRLGFWNPRGDVSEGPNPVYVDIRRIDGDVSEQNSLMYIIAQSLCRRRCDSIPRGL